MEKHIFIILLLSLANACFGQHSSPRELYDSLFIRVQMESVFPDQKTFVDCIPKEGPEIILNKYHAEKDQQDFNLKNFVLNHFTLPQDAGGSYISNIGQNVKQHIGELWKVLSRTPDTISNRYSSLIPLPYSYVVPGGRFREIYYWDSYFTLLGLREDKDTAMIENMVRNFSYLIEQFGFIPNGNRTYYLTRSQPPFFSLMVEVLAELKGDTIYRHYLTDLEKEYNFWMRGSEALKTDASEKNSVNINGIILNRYWDDSDEPREESFKQDVDAAKQSAERPQDFYRNIRAAAESGWDFSSRWFEDGKNLSTIHTTEIIPVDLNCLLYHLEEMIAKGYQIKGDGQSEKDYETKARERKSAILQYCWNNHLHCFCDYGFVEKKPCNTITAAAIFPLFFKLATPAQAEQSQKILKKKLLRKGGIVTTANETGQQWDAPNGWAPLEYITIKGLQNYSFKRLAEKIAGRWIQLNVSVYKNTGKLTEKYNVEDLHLSGGGGEYPLQDGFGWTNGVLLKLMREYGTKD
ncbi:MAG: alpha,alpha-trehalase TreF [Chitinophagales bacterium]|nr:alpha,alpha-trehalase TreF [Chitinophagales bacterium]